MTSRETTPRLPGRSEFPTTQWTLVLAAGNPDRVTARSALVSLCENYWYPLYAYLRRRGYPAARHCTGRCRQSLAGTAAQASLQAEKAGARH